MKLVSKLDTLFRSIFFALAFSCLAPIAFGSTLKPKYKFSGTLDLDYAHHLTDPATPADEKAFLLLEQKAEFNPHWSGVITGQAWVEGAYYNVKEYSTTVQREDGQEIRFQETYLQYKQNRWTIRAGNQQVYWGETIGSFVADIVNPKDLRFGLPIDLTRTTLATPMLNAKYVSKGFSAQVLAVVKPAFHILPLPGEDYFPALPELSSFKQISILRQKDLPMNASNMELGARLSQTFGNADVSLFGMNYFDRNPYYLIEPATTLGQTLVVSEHHERVTSTGAAVAVPLGTQGYMLRAEALYTFGRAISVFDSNLQVLKSKTNEVAVAATLELPPMGRWNFATQFSQSQWIDWAKFVTRKKQDEQYVGGRAAVSLFTSSSLTTLVTWSLLDAGFRIQADFSSPLTHASEFHAGTEFYTGSGSSDFFRIQRANKAYVTARYFFR